MKALICVLIGLLTCFWVNAQENTTEYIYSDDGFEVKTSIFKEYNGNTITCTGLYSKDGKIFVSAISGDWRDNRYLFYVIDGCETIASGAFQSFLDMYVYIPSSVKSIAPDAITSRVTMNGGTNNSYFRTNRLLGIQDGVREQNSSEVLIFPAVNHNAEEEKRYNIQGVRLYEPTNGVNIVQMSDGTVEKIIVK